MRRGAGTSGQKGIRRTLLTARASFCFTSVVSSRPSGTGERVTIKEESLLNTGIKKRQGWRMRGRNVGLSVASQGQPMAQRGAEGQCLGGRLCPHPRSLGGFKSTVCKQGKAFPAAVSLGEWLGVCILVACSGNIWNSRGFTHT